MYVILLLFKYNFCNFDRCSNVSFSIDSRLLLDKSLKWEIQSYKNQVKPTFDSMEQGQSWKVESKLFKKFATFIDHKGSFWSLPWGTQIHPHHTLYL
jgi:hypothetical protein